MGFMSDFITISMGFVGENGTKGASEREMEKKRKGKKWKTMNEGKNWFLFHEQVDICELHVATAVYHSTYTWYITFDCILLDICERSTQCFDSDLFHSLNSPLAKSPSCRILSKDVSIKDNRYLRVRKVDSIYQSFTQCSSLHSLYSRCISGSVYLHVGAFEVSFLPYFYYWFALRTLDRTFRWFFGYCVCSNGMENWKRERETEGEREWMSGFWNASFMKGPFLDVMRHK